MKSVVIIYNEQQVNFTRLTSYFNIYEKMSRGSKKTSICPQASRDDSTLLITTTLMPQQTELVVVSLLPFPLPNTVHYDCSLKAFSFFFQKNPKIP